MADQEAAVQEAGGVEVFRKDGVEEYNVDEDNELLRDPDYSQQPIEYAVDPLPGNTKHRELFVYESPASFFTSIFRAELGPEIENVNPVDRFFRISQRGSTIMKEITGLYRCCCIVVADG
jgi:hypothetical protein